jgi:hypothetical protein
MEGMTLDDLLEQVERNLQAAEPVVEDDATPSHGTMDGLEEKDDSDEKEEEGGNVLRALYLAEHEVEEDVQRLLGELAGGTDHLQQLLREVEEVSCFRHVRHDAHLLCEAN